MSRLRKENNQFLKDWNGPTHRLGPVLKFSGLLHHLTHGDVCIAQDVYFSATLDRVVTIKYDVINV